MTKKEHIQIETYELVLNHYIDTDGRKIKIDEPIITQYIVSHYAPKTIVINEMLNRLSSYVLQMVVKEEKEE